MTSSGLSSLGDDPPTTLSHVAGLWLANPLSIPCASILLAERLCGTLKPL